MSRKRYTAETIIGMIREIFGPALLSHSRSVEARIVEAREEAERLEALIAELRAMQGGEP